IEFEAIQQAQLLHGAKGYARKNAQVGDDGQQSANAESRAFRCGHFHAAANYAPGEIVQLRDVDRKRTLIAGDRQSVSCPKLLEKVSRIDLYRVIGMLKRPPKCLFHLPPDPGSLYLISHVLPS